jgi:DNA-binding NtrC family response regulator
MIESIHDQNKEFILECNKCGHEITYLEFLASTAAFGLIALHGNTDGYLGVLCPKCNKTALQKRPLEYVNSIKSHINALGSPPEFCDPMLRYCHVPHNPKEFFQVKEGTFGGLMKPFLNSKRMGAWEASTKDFGGDLSQAYFSYGFDELAMGPAMGAWWFKEESIAGYLESERQSGLKVFPRYVLYDEFTDKIEEFCWKYYILIEWAAINNYYGYGMAQTMKDLNPGRYRLDRSSDFLKLLEIESFPDKLALPSSLAYAFPAQEGFPPSEIAPESHNRDTEDVKRLWESFHSEKVQEGLFVLGNRFIFEYIELERRTDFSCVSARVLKHKYVKHLLDFIDNPQKRTSIRRQIPEAERRKVKEAEETFPDVKIISEDSAINDIKIKISQLAPYGNTNVDFLLMGETGTGKELFARAIHQASARKGRFIPVNCSAIPESLFESEFFGHTKGAFTDAKKDREGLFQQADGGTLFMDEIGELAPKFQSRFLRVIQEREILPVGGKPRHVDVKLVFATNKDLREEVDNGNFREDLYMRICGFEFEIPPLRQRKHDIPHLVEHIIEKYLKNDEREDRIKMSKEGMDLLKKHSWSGNVRELENVLSKIVVLRSIAGDISDITAAELEDEIERGQRTEPERRKKEKLTDEQILYQMELCGNNKSEVARRLGVDVRTIRRRCNEMGLDK